MGSHMGVTALMLLASGKGRYDIAQTLIERGADKHVKMENG